MSTPPKISIVTPSYNQARYLKWTMESILNQNYPNLENIIVDGGSTDGSAEIIKQNAQSLHSWISEPDNGQYDAINKGFSKSSGEIMAWLNSDDLYLPWTLAAVGKFFQEYPEVSWISGNVCLLNSDNFAYQTALMSGGLNKKLAQRGWYRDGLLGYLPQEGMFWRRRLWEECGGRLDTSLKLAADYELWTRFATHAEPVSAKCLLACFRRHRATQRSVCLHQEYEQEADKVFRVGLTQYGSPY